MGAYLEKLFRKAGKSYGTAKWMYQSLAGSEEESIEAEYNYGKILSSEILRQFQLVNDPENQQNIEEIKEQLYLRVKNKNRTFTIFIIASDEINAFALPGGFIFFTTEILRMLQSNPGQLAFVLAHEMGHIVKGHAMERLVAERAISIISQLGAATNPLGQVLKKLIAKLLYSGYSQDHELEADAFAVKLMDAAHFSAIESVDCLTGLRAAGKSDDLHDFEKYFSSHPDFRIRIKEIKKIING